MKKIALLVFLMVGLSGCVLPEAVAQSPLVQTLDSSFSPATNSGCRESLHYDSGAMIGLTRFCILQTGIFTQDDLETEDIDEHAFTTVKIVEKYTIIKKLNDICFKAKLGKVGLSDESGIRCFELVAIETGRIPFPIGAE